MLKTVAHKLKTLVSPKFRVNTDSSGNSMISLPDGKEIFITTENQVTVIGQCSINVEGTYTVDADEIVLRAKNDFGIVGNKVFINSEYARRHGVTPNHTLPLPKKVTFKSAKQVEDGIRS